MVEHGCPSKKHFEDWDLDGLRKGYHDMFDIDASGIDGMSEAQQIAEKLYADAEAVLKKREEEIGELLYLRIFRNLFLQEIDNQWLEHLQDMDSLREGIGLRGYGQRDPKKEYQKEGFEHFQQLMGNIKGSVVHKMFHFVLEGEDEVKRLEEQRRAKSQARQQRMQTSHAVARGDRAAEGAAAQPQAQPQPGGARPRQGAPAAAPQRPATVKRERPKVGRNEPCWCGSGKKYKQCHLRSDEAGASA
jgi:preprotein translocase subunit SecA